MGTCGDNSRRRCWSWRATLPERAGEGKRFDLRVEDHPTPLAELRRVLQLARAYRYVEEADAAVGQGRYEEAAAAYQMAMELAPEIAELKAWAAIALVQMGQDREAMTLFETAFREDSGVRIEADVDVVPLVELKPHRLRGIRPHEQVAAEDRQLHIHDQLLVVVAHRRLALLHRNIAKASDSSDELSAEDGLVEVERLLVAAHEVEVRASSGHVSLLLTGSIDRNATADRVPDSPALPLPLYCPCSPS